MEKLNEKQAYLAMFYYLEELYKQTHSEDLAGLLGSMNILNDGYPADRAIWQKWLVAIQKSKEMTK